MREGCERNEIEGRAVGIWGIPSLQVTGGSECVIRALWSITWALIDTNHLPSTLSLCTQIITLPRNDDDDDGDCGARAASLPLRLYRRELLNQAFSSRPRGGLLPMILGSPCSAGCHPNMSGKTAAFVICQRDRCGFHTHTENIL